MIPTLTTYCENTTAGNAKHLDLGAVELWYSYETVVALRAPAWCLRLAGLPDATASVISANDWGRTTGKHLNAIDGGGKDAKAARLPRKEFERILSAVMGSLETGDLACG